ncbi:MAG: hypothetical protein HYT87_10760 [Nitrospirae bacterium]|nr:hypothetical protein [Nitrospirota bacterium]
MNLSAVLVVAASALVGEISAVAPTLSIPGQVVRTGAPWALTFSVFNGMDRELNVYAPHNSLYMQGSKKFELHDSLGRPLVSRFSGEIAEPRQAAFWYPLVKQGETFSRTYPNVDRFFGTAPIYDSSCEFLAECPTIPSFPAMTYRARWLLRNKTINPDIVPPLGDPSRIWIGEVWSNTLIIQTTEKEPVKVELDVDPDTLNFKSEGKWITAYLSAPQNAGLLATTTKFQGTVAADRVNWEEGGGRWEAKFPRSLVIDLLKDIRGWELDGLMKVFVSSESGDPAETGQGKMYWGDDKIRILEDPGNAPPSPSPGGKLPTPPGSQKKAPRK